MPHPSPALFPKSVFVTSRLEPGNITEQKISMSGTDRPLPTFTHSALNRNHLNLHPSVCIFPKQFVYLSTQPQGFQMPTLGNYSNRIEVSYFNNSLT